MAGLQAIICAMIDRRSLVAALAAISMLFWTARESAAQSYPQRPVRLVVPAPAGGPTDVPGRLIADGLSGLFNQRFVVENRVGPDRLRLQFAAAAGGESQGSLPIRAGARRLGEKQSGQAQLRHRRRRDPAAPHL